MAAAMHSIYQIDFSNRDVGKRKPKSKKEVTFRFAVNNKEYDLVLNWSFSSGKQSIFVNGIEERFARKGGASILDETFQHDGHTFQLIGTRIKPKGASFNFQCYELLINGSLFSNCPRAGETQPGPSNQGESILDILYPNHSCKNPGITFAAPTMQQVNMYEQPSSPVDMYQTAPVDQPVDTPDILLDTTPVSTNTGHATSDMFLPMEQPAHNNYSVPTTETANPFGGQEIQAANPFDGQIQAANPFESNNTAAPFNYSLDSPYNNAQAAAPNQNTATTGDLLGF